MSQLGKIERYFVYAYKNPRTNSVEYVGYGTEPGRAYPIGHNTKILEKLEELSGFQIYISGPYRDEEEARNVEAALVSLLKPDLNQIDQPGKRFRPFGVPLECGDRHNLPTLSPSEIGIITGGAIIVYCNLNSESKSGVSKVGPTNFSDEVVFENIKEYWKVKKFIPDWIENVTRSPRVLVGVQGAVGSRMIIGAAHIDAEGWRTTPVAPWDRHVHRIPLKESAGLDINQLRGRWVDIKFGAGPANYWALVDGSGKVLHGYRMK